MCLLWSPFSCRPLPNYRMITLHGSCASESTLYSNLQWYFVNVVVQVFQYLLFVLNYKLERSSCWSITGIDGSEQLKTDAMDSTVFTCLHRVPQEYRHSRAWDVTTMVAQSKQQHFSSELSNTCGVNDMEHVETLLWYQWYPCRCSRAVARVKLLLSAVVRSTNFGNFVDGCASSVLSLSAFCNHVIQMPWFAHLFKTVRSDSVFAHFCATDASASAWTGNVQMLVRSQMCLLWRCEE